MSTELSQIKTFLESPLTNTYISTKEMNLYVRKSKRFLEGKIYNCFDLARILVYEPNRGKGIFTKFYKELVSTYPEMNIFVESILNERFAERLKFLGLKEKRYYEQLDMYLIQNKQQ